MVSKAQVKAIVEAVGFEPDSLDHKALERDLNRAAIGLTVREVIESTPDDEKRADRLATVQRRTETLLKSLGSTDQPLSDDLWFALGAGGQDSDFDPDLIVPFLEDLRDAAVKARQIYSNDGQDGRDSEEKSDPALQYIITNRLPKIYTSHFSKAFGASIDRRNRPGPGLRFVVACLAAFGPIMTPEAVKRRFSSRRP